MSESKRKAARGETAPPRLRTIVAFTSDPKIAESLAVSNPLSVVLDIDAAADKLRRAGYEVFRLPDEDERRFCVHPFEGYLEAHSDGRNERKFHSAIYNEIDAIVGPHGGLCTVCGPIKPGHVPFADFDRVQRCLCTPDRNRSFDEASEKERIRRLDEVFEELAAKGQVRDSGERRNGQIVWETIPGKTEAEVKAAFDEMTEEHRNLAVLALEALMEAG